MPGHASGSARSLRMLLLAAAVAACALPAAAREPEGARLAREKQCLQCHAVAQDTIGPSFRTIRATYRRMDRAEAAMVSVIREGSAANLGPLRGHARMPDMAERPEVSEAEARRLARWILRGDLR